MYIRRSRRPSLLLTQCVSPNVTDASYASLASVFTSMSRSRTPYPTLSPPRTAPTEALVRSISQEKNEPTWMLEKRLEGLYAFWKRPLPSWGPDLTQLDLERINYHPKPNVGVDGEKQSWEEVPESIRETFEKLGIPEAERTALAGAGAQFDSDTVYHNLKAEFQEKGVVFESMDTALHTHEELVRTYFMTRCVPVTDHLFTMLHAAVWSGGTFIYVPRGVHVGIPLQAYVRMNEQSSGQFEHTLIIAEQDSVVHYIEGCSAPKYTSSSLHAGCVEIYVQPGAHVKYSSIENWSKNTYNLNTKRAVVETRGHMEWINGNIGSHTTMLYPMSILRGAYAKAHSVGVAFAGDGQTQDTGMKVVHAAPHTSSTILSKSVAKDGGVSTYRGLVKITAAAKQSSAHVQCDALMLDEASQAHTFPTNQIDTNEAQLTHEASTGKINEQQLFFLQTRGLSEEDARRLIVSGFLEPMIKTLPLEYAVEFNKLVELERDGAAV